MSCLDILREEITYLLKTKWSIAEVGAYWDKTRDYEAVSMGTDSYCRRFVESFLMLPPIATPVRLLDICCRTGNGTLYFSERLKLTEVTCIDPSDFFLQSCREKIEKAGVTANVTKMVDYTLPLADHSLDLILCLESIEHFSEPEALMAELSRVLHPEGWLILTTPNLLWEPVHSLAALTGLHFGEGPHTFLSRRRLLDLFAETGLEIHREHTRILIPGGPRWLINFGDRLERWLGERIVSYLGLRRHFLLRLRETVRKTGKPCAE